MNLSCPPGAPTSTSTACDGLWEGTASGDKQPVEAGCFMPSSRVSKYPTEIIYRPPLSSEGSSKWTRLLFSCQERAYHGGHEPVTTGKCHKTLGTTRS